MDMDRNAPATKGDLLDLRNELGGELRQDFEQKLSGLRDDLIEAIHDSHTALLRAFYGFTQTVQDRFTSRTSPTPP